MAGRRSDGPIAKAVSRLRFSRLTPYQSLALDLGDIALEMPLDVLRPNDETRGTLFRHSTQFPPGRLLMWWVLNVAEENLLAGVVLLDALEMFVDLLAPVLPDRLRFPDTQDKTDWTQRVGPFDVEFVVPEGWEFVFAGAVHPAGFRGVACVDRCHLSERAGHYDEGRGRIAVPTDRSVGSSGGFDLPCAYYPGVRVVGDEVVEDDPAHSSRRDASLPYEFVVRAFQRPIRYSGRPTSRSSRRLGLHCRSQVKGSAAAAKAGDSEPWRNRTGGPGVPESPLLEPFCRAAGGLARRAVGSRR
jgi:hypothetical protein